MKPEKSTLNFIYSKSWLLVICLVVNDLLSFVVSIGLVSIVRKLLIGTTGEQLFDPQVIRTIFFLVSFTLLVMMIKGLYPGRGRISVVELKQVSESIIIAYAVIGVLIFIQGKAVNFSRSVYLLSGVFNIIFISIGRILVRKMFSKFPWWGEPVVIIGKTADILNAAKKITTCSRLGFRPVIGLSIDGAEVKNDFKFPILPWSIEEQEKVHNANINTLILAASTTELREDYPLVYHSVGLSFKKTIFLLENDIYGSMMAQPVDLNGQPAILSHQSLLNPYLRLIKYLFEFIACLTIAVPTSLICLLLALLIKLDSPGPVLYTQERIGKNLKPFQLFKFRTMVENSEEILAELLKEPKNLQEWEEFHKLENDPRITRVGKFIRKFSLDELPQFINILRGEMSLIGPRPLVQSEIDQMGDTARLVFTVNPGLTGWWQVNGRNNLSFNERAQLDLYYVFNWSLWLDLYIVIKSFWVILFERSGK